MSLAQLKEKLDKLTKIEKINLDKTGFILFYGYDSDGNEIEITKEESDINDLLEEILSLADSCLITKSGHPDFVGHNYLASYGYRITKGESDGFGWLTGVISTPVGKILFG